MALTKVQKDRAKKRVQFLTALEASANNISLACEKIGVSRQWYYSQLDDRDFEMKVDHQFEKDVDFAETALKRNIRNGDTTAIIFFLKTRGKKRGYVERIEQTGVNGGPIDTRNINANYDMSKEQLLELADATGNEALRIMANGK